MKVSKAAMRTHHANIQGARVGRRVQETTGKWLVKECKNFELLWIFYSFLMFKNKNKFWNILNSAWEGNPRSLIGDTWFRKVM